MTRLDKKEIKGPLQVYQSNDLIEAYFPENMTVTEHKIIRYAIARIGQNPETFPYVQFTVKEFLEETGMSGHGYYQRISELTEGLMSKSFRLSSKDAPESDFAWYTWFTTIRYKDGVVTAEFNHHIAPLITNLTGRFTKYALLTVGKLQSTYTFALFELLTQYEKIGKRTVTIDYLRKSIGLGDKYPQYANLKARILVNAQKELREINAIDFTFKEIRSGRRVTAIEFNIQRIGMLENVMVGEKETRLFLEQAKPLLKEYGYSIPTRTLKTWAGYGIEELRIVLKDINENDRSMTSPEAYINAILAKRKTQIDQEAEAIQADNYLTKKHIIDFIRTYSSGSNLPKSIIGQEFRSYMYKRGYEQEEVEAIWEDNEVYILESGKLTKY